MFRPKTDKPQPPDTGASASGEHGGWRRANRHEVQEAADADASADADGAQSAPTRVGGSGWGRRAAAQVSADTEAQEAPPPFTRSLGARKALDAGTLSATDRALLQQVRPASEWLEAAGTGRDRTERDRSERDRPGRVRPELEGAEGAYAGQAPAAYTRSQPIRSDLSSAARHQPGYIRADDEAPDVEDTGSREQPSRAARFGAANRAFSGRKKAAPSAANRGTRTSLSGTDAAAMPDACTEEDPAAQASAYSRTSDRARRPQASRGRRAEGRVRENTDAHDAFAVNEADSPDAAADGRSSRGPGLSLKARAVGFLSRREHSRHELARKLARYSEDPGEIATVLDSLQRENWLSDERFATSLIHRRASRQGASRIVQELRQHGVAPEAVAEMRDTLRATEFTRAQDVWRRRYGQPPRSPADRARQQRFLAARGFDHEVIRRVVGPVVGDASADEADD